MKYALITLCFALPALASAQSVETDVAAARAALETGDLLGAGAAVDRGFASASLRAEELATLYELRALLAYADDRLGALEEALHALASLGAPMPALFPPPLRTRYDEVRAAAEPIGLSLELVTEVERDRRIVRLVPRVDGDLGHVVRSVRVRAAIDEAPLALRTESDSLEAGSAHAAVELRYALEAIGPGGAIVATRGSDAAPVSEVLGALPVDETFLHVTLWTIGGVVIGTAIALAIAYVATDGFTTGQPTHLEPMTCTGGPCSALITF